MAEWNWYPHDGELDNGGVFVNPLDDSCIYLLVDGYLCEAPEGEVLMPESAYQRLCHALALENDRWTRNGLRLMIGNDEDYRRWLQNYVFQKYGLNWQTVQREIRQEFLNTSLKFIWPKRGRIFPLSPPTTRERNSCICLPIRPHDH